MRIEPDKAQYWVFSRHPGKSRVTSGQEPRDIRAGAA